MSPPGVTPVPTPTTYGVDATRYLEAHGLVAHKPAIRSSDFEMCLGDPFRYYLTRRLGLIPALQYSPALNHGTWFHRHVESLLQPEDTRASWLDTHLFGRFDELKAACRQFGIGATEQQSILNREEFSFTQARAWFEAMCQLPLATRRRHNFLKWLFRPDWKIVDAEVRIVIERDELGVPCVAQIDLLVYDVRNNRLWIIDLKTCTEPTVVRLQTCPIEFQTEHYLHTVSTALDRHIIQRHYDLPMDCRLAGMIHFAVQKPPLTLGSYDRDYTEHEHTITRGPRKGQVETRRKYTGEPRLANHVARCLEWYRAQGQYTYKAEEHRHSPPVNLSTTTSTQLIDTNAIARYNRRLALVNEYATCAPHPSAFEMSAHGLRAFGKMSPLSPFYLTPPQSWPNIAAQERFIQGHRDEDLLKQ